MLVYAPYIHIYWHIYTYMGRSYTYKIIHGCIIIHTYIYTHILAGHPLLLVYAPRDESEAELCLQILEAAADFALIELSSGTRPAEKQ